VSFSVDNAGLFDALDQLALQSRSAWNSLDARTILVMDDSQQNRRDYGAQIVKTVYLPASSTPTEIYGILNVLRTALTLRGVYQHETARAIVIRDVPSRVALAERVIGHLNTSSTPIASVLLPSQGITENGSLGIASSARKQLQPAASGTASLNLNADARTAFETVGKIAGVAVTFHPRFTAGSASPLRVDGVDAVDLLDYVALVTGKSSTAGRFSSPRIRGRRGANWNRSRPRSLLFRPTLRGMRRALGMF
jgi:hypothetical protein